MRGLFSTTGVFILIFSILSTSYAQSICPSSRPIFRLDKYSGQPQKQKTVRIASASVFPEKWNKEVNWTRIETRIREAVCTTQAQLVVTPEGVLEGYVINEVNREKDEQKHRDLIERFRQLAEPMDGPYIQKSRDLADELDIFLVLGFLERRNDDDRGEVLYNTAILIDPDGDIIGRYSKTHFAQGYTINPSCYLPGDDYPVFDTPFGKVGIMICYDRQLPENARILALKGAQILLVPSYGSYDQGNGWNTLLLRTRAYENRCALVFTHPCQSLLITRHGDLKAIGKQDEIVWYEVDTDPEKIKDRFDNRRPSLYLPLVEGENR